MGKYSIGVRVRDCDGDEGEIIDKRKGERHVRYDRPLPTLWWPKHRLVVVTDAPLTVEAAMPADILKVGDRVRFISDYYPPKGMIGTIVDNDNTDVLPFDVAFDNLTDGHSGNALDDSENHWHCDASQLELVEEAPAPEAPKWEPKIGDRVRVTKATAGRESYIGTEFVVTAEDTKWDDERSWSTSSNPYRFKTSELEPVVDPAKPGPEFKIGDRVIVLNHENYMGYSISLNIEIGTVVVIKEALYQPLPDGITLYRYICDVDAPHFYLDRNLAPAPTDFRVGDVVRRDTESCAPDAYGVKGETYTVKAVSWGLDIGLCCGPAETSSFSLVRRPPALASTIKPPHPLPIGAEVVLTGPARISGFDKKNANLVLDTGGTFTLPLAAIKAA